MQLLNLAFALTAARRVCLNTAAIGIGLLLVGGTTHADERAESLLRRAAETLQKTQSLSAEFTTQTVYPTRYRDTQELGTVWLARPHRVHIEINRYRKPEDIDTWIATGNGSTVVADGSKAWTLIRHPHSAQYRSTPDDAPETNNILNSIEPLRGFFRADTVLTGDATFIDTRRWEDADYDVVSIKRHSPEANTDLACSAELYFGRDGLIHRYVLKEVRKDGSTTREVTLRNIKRDTHLAPGVFVFKLPSGAEAFEPAPPAHPLSIGTEAPDFTAEDRAGSAVHLSDLRGKIVILKFWATWCWSCRQSLPQTELIARHYGDKDVVVLAVDIWDSRKALRNWLSKRSEHELIRYAIDPKPQGKDAATTLYHIRSTPTQFVIDKDGRILKVVEGYLGPDDQLETALAQAIRSTASHLNVPTPH